MCKDGFLHAICLHKFCVIITEMLFTQSNVYTKVRFTHEFVNDIFIDFVEW